MQETAAEFFLPRMSIGNGAVFFCAAVPPLVPSVHLPMMSFASTWANANGRSSSRPTYPANLLLPYPVAFRAVISFSSSSSGARYGAMGTL